MVVVIHDRLWSNVEFEDCFFEEAEMAALIRIANSIRARKDPQALFEALIRRERTDVSRSTRLPVRRIGEMRCIGI